MTCPQMCLHLTLSAIRPRHLSYTGLCLTNASIVLKVY